MADITGRRAKRYALFPLYPPNSSVPNRTYRLNRNKVDAGDGASL